MDASETHTLMELNWIYPRGRGGIRRVPEWSELVKSLRFLFQSVGTHEICFDSATIVVNSFGSEFPWHCFPHIRTSGSITGGDIVTFTSTGFTYSFNNTIAQFGVWVSQTGSAISIWSSTTISVVSVSPLIPISVQVQVSIETPLARSKGASVQFPFRNTNRYLLPASVWTLIKLPRVSLNPMVNSMWLP
jgi:hypothetical protein